MSSSADFVSVIIPAYNAASYIKATIESVLAQTYRHFEIIVVNDGSPDTITLEEVLSPYRQSITYITQENRGLSGARNTGLRAAKGNLISLLDADDIWLPDYLEQQVSFLQGNPEIDLVYCDAEFFGEDITPGQFYMVACPSEGEATAAAIISKQCTVFVSVTSRRGPLQAIGFDESLRSCEDLDCWLRFTAAGYRIGYQRKVLARYRRHAASLSANAERMLGFNIQVMNNALALFPAQSQETQLIHQAIEKRKAELNIVKGKKALKSGDIDAAKTHIHNANLYYRSAKNRWLLRTLRVFPALVTWLFRTRSLMSVKHRQNNG